MTFPPPRLLFLPVWLAVSGLGACQKPTSPAEAGGRRLATGWLPPALTRLLPPLPGANPEAVRADVARLGAARVRWGGDSLGQLLVHSRLAADFAQLQQHDSAYWHLLRAWRMAGPQPRRQQPAYVVTAAQSLGNYHYGRGGYDSARTYYQRAIAAFRAAGLDSSQGVRPSMVLPTTAPWSQGGTLAGSLANAGLASRHLGSLTEALCYYEHATTLYQQQRSLPGLTWTLALVGEAQAEQGNCPQALAAYEQALGTARTYTRQNPRDGCYVLANVVLDYYAPLLLARPGQRAYASQLAAEVGRALLAAPPPPAGPATYDYLLLARLQLVPAEAALRAGQPGTAGRWLAEADRWLVRAAAGPLHGQLQPSYAEAQALTWGLRAWQQHAASPARARHLLGQAAALLAGAAAYSPQAQSRQLLATYCLAMGEPGRAAGLLRPLEHLFQRQRSPLSLSQVTELQTQAYAAAGRYDSAYAYARRTQALTDTVRAARQFAALAATEARFRTREQASQIRLLTERSRQQVLRTGVAAGGAALFGLALLATMLAWRATRRLNRRLAAQSALLQAQADRLASLDSTKNQFFANVSHELRTPLTLVLGPLQQALTLARSAAQRELLATSARAGQRLRELIDRILDLTKLEAGKLDARPEPTRLPQLLQELLTQFEPLAATGGITLNGPADLPAALTVHLDGDKLRQILTNLLANALQHTPPDGRVALSFAQPSPDCYALTVQDTGPGIAPAEQARVFERFYQSPQRQARGGTGLGLALSRELAALLGGQLILVSTPGQGATFTLTFSAERLPDAPPSQVLPDPAPGPLPPPAEQPQRPPARPRILLVEDHAELRAYVRNLLAAEYEVLEATDGEQALTLLAHQVVDLVVSDAMMPQRSGLELLHQLRAAPDQQGLPFLMMTARADDAHRLAALATGVDDYLIKPFEAPELLARTRALLAHAHARQRYAAAQPVVAGQSGPAAEPPPAPALATQLGQWQAQVADRLANEQFGPTELAELLCLSERTLYRRLGELAGLTPAAWLRELRLAKARRLLEAGGFHSVSTVATAVGFASPKYFATLYTERFGRRPSDYRTQG